MITIMIISLSAIFLTLLIFGLIQCRKHSFTAGFYFFLILIFHQTLPYIYAPFINKYIDFSLTNGNSPMGLTLGEFVALSALLPRIIEVIAFSFLVVGLYRMWKSTKTIKS